MVEAESNEFDYLVIGAGSGGVGSGRFAAGTFGTKVCIIENRAIGGTCVNVGCVPKKVMFNLASFLEEAHLFADYGVKGTEGLKLDYAFFKERRDAYVKRLNGIYVNMLNNNGVKYVEGLAQFVDAKTVEVEGKHYKGKHILIASGSYPSAPTFPGSEHCMDSDDFFTMTELPEKMVVIGGGYIGVELAQIMQALGVKTTLVVRSQILRFLDEDVRQVLLENMEKLGLDVRLNSPHEKVEKLGENEYALHLANGDKIECNKVLVALGRPPNVDPLKLENCGVKVDKYGSVIVDEYSNTNVEGIYAVGDVITGALGLTPVAIRAGRILAWRLFGGRKDLKMNYTNVATAVFSHPPIGTVGLNEEEAIKKFGEDKVVTFKGNFVNMLYSPTADEKKKLKSLFKLVCVQTGPEVVEEGNAHLKVVGANGIGKTIDEMIQLLSVCLNMGATK